jgi:hypothetical protein
MGIYWSLTEVSTPDRGNIMFSKLLVQLLLMLTFNMNPFEMVLVSKVKKQFRI